MKRCREALALRLAGEEARRMKRMIPSLLFRVFPRPLRFLA
jgi:hypothetical protein